MMTYCPFKHLVPPDAAVCPECGTEIEGGTRMPTPRDQPPEIVDTPTERLAHLASGLRTGAHLLEGAVVLGTFLGALAGVVLMAQTEGYDDEHPYVAAGVVVVVSSIFAGILYWCIARALRIYAEHTAVSHSIDLDDV